MAGLLARGFRPIAAFPVTQWQNDDQLSAYSCGGSRGFDAIQHRTAFPIHLTRREDHRLHW